MHYCLESTQYHAWLTVCAHGGQRRCRGNGRDLVASAGTCVELQSPLNLKNTVYAHFWLKQSSILQSP